MIKVTVSLDADTIASLERMASRLAIPKSRVVGEAVRLYREQLERLTEEERDRLLRVLDEVAGSIPDRARAKVENELAELRRSRGTGGRRTPETRRP